MTYLMNDGKLVVMKGDIMIGRADILRALYYERAELFRQARDEMKAAREKAEHPTEMFAAIRAGGTCEQMIQHIVGCSCHSTGASECGGMELDDMDELRGSPCECPCHDLCMARPSDTSRAHVEINGYVGMALMRITYDKFDK